MINDIEANLMLIVDRLGEASLDYLQSAQIDISVISILLREEMIESRCFFVVSYYMLTNKGKYQLDLWKAAHPNWHELAI